MAWATLREFSRYRAISSKSIIDSIGAVEMSWYSKVFWSEGLFLRPHHLQQNDRYLEHFSSGGSVMITPYPWGFSSLGDRPRSRPAKQIRAAPRVRHHARWHAFRHPGRQSAPGADRCAGYRRRADRLAVDAGRRAQYARSRRHAMPKAPADTSSGLETFIDFHLGAAHRRRNRHRLSAARASSCARPQSPDTSASASRAFWKFATRTSCSTRNSCRRC